MTQQAGMSNGRGEDGQKPAHRDPSQGHRPSRRRRGTRRSYFAIKASEGIINLPRVPPLGYLTQSRLIERAQQGDIDARQKVWLANARLAYSIINRYRVPPEMVPDALQATQVGIHRAIDKFEPDRLNEFSTYAYYWLRQAVDRYRWHFRFATRIPAHLYAPYRRFIAQVVDQQDYPAAWCEAVHAWLDEDAKCYHKLLRLHLIAQPQPLPKDKHLADRNGPSPHEQAAQRETRRLLLDALDQLKGQQRLVIEQRYGIPHGHAHTLEEIGVMLGVTRERVRQIQAKAEMRLRFLLRKAFPELAGEPTGQAPPPDDADARPPNPASV